MPTEAEVKAMKFIVDVRKIGKSILKEISRDLNQKFEYNDFRIGCRLVSNTHTVLLEINENVKVNNSWIVNVIVQDKQKTLGTSKITVSSKDTYNKSDLKKAQQSIIQDIVFHLFKPLSY